MLNEACSLDSSFLSAMSNSCFLGYLASRLSLSLCSPVVSFLDLSLLLSASADRGSSSSPQIRGGDIISKTFPKRFQVAPSKTPEQMQDQTLRQKGGIECK